MTQWRGPGWPTVTAYTHVFTAAERVEFYHDALMCTPPEEYDEIHRLVTGILTPESPGEDGEESKTYNLNCHYCYKPLITVVEIERGIHDACYRKLANKAMR